EFVGSNWDISPQTFYAKEGDRICIKFSVTDTSKTLVIQNTPLFLRAYPNKEADEGLMLPRKVGEYTVTCNGCNNKKAKIIVQSTREFEAFQRRLDRYNSFQYRTPPHPNR